MPKLTKDQATERFCRDWGLDRERLLSRHVYTVLCECGDDFCDGWKLEYRPPKEGPCQRPS